MTRRLTDDEWETIESSACGVANGDLRDDYSGRGMYGAQCIGFTEDSHRNAAIILVDIARTDEELAAEMARDLTVDQMGRGMIFYFPSLQAPATDGCPECGAAEGEAHGCTVAERSAR